MNTAPLPHGRHSGAYGDLVLRDEQMLKGLSRLAGTANRGPRPLTDDLVRQRIQTKLDLEYGITIKNDEASHLIKTLLANEVDRGNLIESGVGEVVEGQIKAFFLNQGLVLIPLSQALEVTRELIRKISAHAPSIIAFYRDHHTEKVLSALWHAHNGSVRSALGDDVEEVSKEQLAKIGYPEPAEFEEMVASAKRKKRGDKGYTAAGEKLGWFLVGEDPKVRENWSVA